MEITIWHKNGAGTKMTADDFSRIEVDGGIVWNSNSFCKKAFIAKPVLDEVEKKVQKIKEIC
jgi:hypothetical protein